MIRIIAKNIVSTILQLLTCIIPKGRNIIIFGSYSGKYFGDNSKALYLYLLKKKASPFRPIWLSDKQDIIKEIRRKGGEAYRKKSLKGIWMSIRADLVVTSHSLSDALLYCPVNNRPKELYLHHGIPLRKQIFREKQTFLSIPPKTSLSRFQRVTLTIATSRWAAEQQLNNVPVKKERTKITGLPRNDVLFFNEDRDAIKKRYGLGKFVILYAPTFREGTARFFPFADRDINGIISFLRKRQMTMILRPHHTDLGRRRSDIFWEKIKNNKDVFKIITIFDHTDVNELLKVTDCLITDYSSMHYDYLLTDRPIIYLPYDIKQYVRKWGGFNCDYEQFTPGPKPKTQREFLQWLEKFYEGNDNFAEERQRLKNTVHNYQDGNSCRRVYDLIKKEIVYENRSY